MTVTEERILVGGNYPIVERMITVGQEETPTVSHL